MYSIRYVVRGLFVRCCTHLCDDKFSGCNCSYEDISWGVSGEDREKSEKIRTEQDGVSHDRLDYIFCFEYFYFIRFVYCLYGNYRFVPV